MLETVEFCVTDREEAVRAALARMLLALAPLNLAVEEKSTIELVFAEVLNNIVKHAYREILSPGKIHVSAQMHSNGLHVSFLDDGAPMPDGVLPLGLPHDLSVEVPDLPETEFGWFLIRGLAKDVRYRREAGRNQLDLRLAIARPHGH